MPSLQTRGISKIPFYLSLPLFIFAVLFAALFSLTGCLVNTATIAIIYPSPIPSVAPVGTISYPLAGPGNGGAGSVGVAISLTSISPPSGGTGVTLSLSGVGFVSNATVSIGGVNCPATVKSTFFITCIVPVNAVSATAYPVTVTNPDLTSSTLSAAFTYNNPPTVTAISPLAGGSGTTVTITGTFGTTASSVSCPSTTTCPTVTIGGSSCSLTSGSNNSSLVCVTGSNVPGPANVVVTNLDLQQQTLSNGFTYAFLTGQVTSGYDHTCTIVSGGVQCWGLNNYGQLGNSSTAVGLSNNNLPTFVTGLTSGVQSVSAGYNHTCALVNSGIQCWGYNAFGQLGNNTTSNSAVPVSVTNASFPYSPLSNVQAVASGMGHTCAIVNGGVWCWGLNTFGQLGNNTTTNGTTPVQVLTSAGGNPALKGVSAIAAGAYHTCALQGGNIFCWGLNTTGQLGINAATANVTTASSVKDATSATLGNFQAVTAGGYHTCGIQSGTALCWGMDTFGQLGNGKNSTGTGKTATDTTVPDFVLISGGAVHLTEVQSIAAGEFSTCAIINGAAKCWGLNTYGALGEGSTTERDKAFTVSSPATSGLNSISAGGRHSCAMMNNGILCWGLNLYGELGNAVNAGVLTNNSTPLSVDGSSTVGTPVYALNRGITAMGTGSSHSCSIVGGNIQCWGLNASGQIGDGTQVAKLIPTAVVGSGALAGAIVGALAVAGGASHTCALLGTSVTDATAHTGNVVCWGDNTYGQLGDGSNTAELSPTTVVQLSGGTAQAIAVGSYHACALVNGSAQCWGHNPFGQLGNGVTTDSSTPVTAAGTFQAISAGAFHTCALSSGAPYCWGYNSSGQLGATPTTIYQASPVAAALAFSPAFATSITAGAYHTCAIVNGGAQCWGDNSSGQLGNGSTQGTLATAKAVIVTTPCPAGAPPASCPPLLTGVTQISAGSGHTCAIAQTTYQNNSLSAVQCWGSNSNGQLGINSILNQTSASVMQNSIGSAPLSGAQNLSVGGNFSCVLINGAIQCTGQNTYGSLGNNSTTRSLLPVASLGF